MHREEQAISHPVCIHRQDACCQKVCRVQLVPASLHHVFHITRTQQQNNVRKHQKVKSRLNLQLPSRQTGRRRLKTTSVTSQAARMKQTRLCEVVQAMEAETMISVNVPLMPKTAILNDFHQTIESAEGNAILRKGRGGNLPAMEKPFHTQSQFARLCAC